ncbi:hypothetical protein AC578_9015 [Pseudocercospora eumusae]|uniref:Uncharacterized protein n=1 Tax=Pseudocercospora eumusae TaxID=321146 RepID=A0A139H2Q2_9PEZI|nr:hypothetical protein AC578_9015 [Pseudocercospora eumusae]
MHVNHKEEDIAPEALFGLMCEERMRQYLHCSQLELDRLKDIVKRYMKFPDYNGEPLLGKWLSDFDPNQAHRRALWARVAQHDDTCREMLSGSRFTESDKPNNLEKYLEAIKTKIVLSHRMYALHKRRKGVAAIPAPAAKRIAQEASVGGGVEQHKISEEQQNTVEIEQMNEDQDDEEILPVKDEQPVNPGVRSVAAASVHPETRIGDVAFPIPNITTVTPVTPAPAATPSSLTAHPPCDPASGQSFNEQMMLMMVQNQQIMMKMMSEIQNLKKGGQ